MSGVRSSWCARRMPNNSAGVISPVPSSSADRTSSATSARLARPHPGRWRAQSPPRTARVNPSPSEDPKHLSDLHASAADKLAQLRGVQSAVASDVKDTKGVLQRLAPFRAEEPHQELANRLQHPRLPRKPAQLHDDPL
eukprot:CAMPEP_0175759666 /NCGR_PEP_ID=MMETSP0097-20121207/65689_1 /TAXON_ID=311494 /ORGANISM="Alexandrium monilatum, Strain CCMP3105" /LENGTH=138 /DNA_ID=CAMNT_0017069071 /DNA_START=55 /DNA_END=469 /DNA_ORIENTATION=-